MLVVADTSSIHVLVRIGYVDVLPRLFEQVFIPAIVAKELIVARYDQVRTWMTVPPA
jgi:predicted nucleic acid-binding protein